MTPIKPQPFRTPPCHQIHSSPSNRLQCCGCRLAFANARVRDATEFEVAEPHPFTSLQLSTAPRVMASSSKTWRINGKLRLSGMHGNTLPPAGNHAGNHAADSSMH
eukprot:12445306-Alexandrium_andersonii.AAC.1